MLASFAKALPAGCRVDYVEPTHVEAFVTAPKRDRKREGNGAEVAWHAAPVSGGPPALLRVLPGRGYTRTDPTAGLAPAKGRANRREHITDAEGSRPMFRTLDAAEVLDGRPLGWLRDWIVVGLGTGLRPGEQAALTWPDVRLAEGALRVRGTKTDGSARPVPFAGDAADVLRQRAESRTGEGESPVFTAARGGPVEMRSLSKRLQALAVSAGVGKNVTAYSLRHSYGTRMAAAGVPLLDLARIMGTSVQMIERHYGHYCPQRGAAHVARVFGTAVETETAPRP